MINLQKHQLEKLTLGYKLVLYSNLLLFIMLQIVHNFF